MADLQKELINLRAEQEGVKAKKDAHQVKAEQAIAPARLKLDEARAAYEASQAETDRLKAAFIEARNEHNRIAVALGRKRPPSSTAACPGSGVGKGHGTKMYAYEPPVRLPNGYIQLALKDLPDTAELYEMEEGATAGAMVRDFAVKHMPNATRGMKAGLETKVRELLSKKGE